MVPGGRKLNHSTQIGASDAFALRIKTHQGLYKTSYKDTWRKCYSFYLSLIFILKMVTPLRYLSL